MTRGINTEQRTQKWFADRCGCLTASIVGKVLKRTKAGWSTGRAEEISRLICERITNQCQETAFSNAAMQWGTETEPMAKEAYELQSGNIVEDVGFVHHPSIDFFGASPDGLIGEDGLVEIKCPTTKVHLERCLSEEIPEHYKLQMQVQMICTGRKWCDFVDYDPRLTGSFERFQLLVIRYQPTQDELDVTEKLCVEFLEEVKQGVRNLLSLLEREDRNAINQ